MKYIVAYSEYMGDEPYMESKEADSLKDLILNFMGSECDEDVEEWFDKSLEEVTEKEVIMAFQDQNGDGCPYVCIYDVAADKQVI